MAQIAVQVAKQLRKIQLRLRNDWLPLAKMRVAPPKKRVCHKCKEQVGIEFPEIQACIHCTVFRGIVMIQVKIGVVLAGPCHCNPTLRLKTVSVRAKLRPRVIWCYLFPNSTASEIRSSITGGG